MELEEFKQIWTQYDNKLNESLKFNEQLFKSMKTDKYNHALKKPYYLEIVSIIILSFAFLFTTVSSISIIHDFKFSIPGLAGALLCLVFIVLSITTANRLRNLLECNANIIEHQRELVRLKTFILRTRLFAYVAGPLMGFFILPVYLKAVANLNIYDKPEFIILYSFFIVLGLIIGILLNLSVYDKGIKDAEMFLIQINEFEKSE